MFTQSSTEESRFHSVFPWLMSELYYKTKADHVKVWATTSMTERLQKQNNYPSLFFLADIQECYEVTLQLNKEQTVVKEDSRQDAWEVIFFLLYIIEHMLTLYMVSHMLSCIASGLLTAQGSSAASARCHYPCLSLSCSDQMLLMSQCSYDFNLLNKRQTQRLFRKRHTRWGRRGNHIETKALRALHYNFSCCSYNLACLTDKSPGFI